MENEKIQVSREQLNVAIRLCQAKTFGVVDRGFLCQSVSTLKPAEPVTVKGSCCVVDAIALLQQHNLGCLLVTDGDGKLTGIFTERDCILKVLKKNRDLNKERVETYMTRNPMAEAIDVTIAYAMTLMSQGGFRHLPLIDGGGYPVGVVSIKDLVDYISLSAFNDLLNFATE